MFSLKRLTAIILALILITALFAGCEKKPESEQPRSENNGEPQTPVIGGGLTVGITADLDADIDPHNMVSAATRELLFNIYEGLVKPDSEGNLIPAVAERYKISITGDSFTFTLRDGVTFHDGQAVTAGDVVYSISRAAGLDTGTPLVDGLGIITSIEATDDKTVVINLSEPNIEVLALLTAAIIPEGSNPNTDIVGTGPFKFVSRVPQESILIEKYEGYWGTPAYLDSVTYKVIDNTETLIMSLMSGALDLVAHLTTVQLDQIGSGYNVSKGSMNIVQAVYLNNAAAPLDNVEVRRALSYAIDRQSIMDFLYNGDSEAVGSSMYPNFKKYFREDLVDYYSQDIEKAKQMLADAGYPDGFSMTITVPSNYQQHVDTATIVAEQLKAVGVTAEVRIVDWATWLSDVYTGRDFEATIIGLEAKTLTARALLERFVSSSGSNFINFNSAEYDDVYNQAQVCTDEAEQVELYKRLQGILTEQAANLYIHDFCDIVVMQPNVGGYEFYPLYVMDMSKVFFTE